ncbi:MAG: hypothetical protein IBJ12_02590 [Sphingomonadaceae bacterium]|nr:hypothetical protein [Sphingomonadaceae bacterium]
MDSIGTVLVLINQLEITLEKIEAISTREDEERKYELVQLRRSLAEIIGQITEASLQLFAAISDRSIEEGFRARLNDMRHAVALHQASFPASAIDQHSADYRASVMRVRNTNREFIDWAKPMLGRLKRS